MGGCRLAPSLRRALLLPSADRHVFRASAVRALGGLHRRAPSRGPELRLGGCGRPLDGCTCRSDRVRPTADRTCESDRNTAALKNGRRPWKAARRRGAVQQRLERLGFEVGQPQWMVALPRSALSIGPHERVIVSSDLPRPGLDLHDEHALRAAQHQVDVVEPAARIEELEVRPASVRLVFGKVALQERASASRSQANSDGVTWMPVARRAVHAQPSSSIRGWRRRMKSPNSGAVYA